MECCTCRLVPGILAYHKQHHVFGVRGPENGSFFSMNSLRHLLWIMSDTTKAVAEAINNILGFSDTRNNTCQY